MRIHNVMPHTVYIPLLSAKVTMLGFSRESIVSGVPFRNNFFIAVVVFVVI